jgi:hypothetical protein
MGPDPKKLWWWIDPPKGVRPDAEWEWYCYRTRSQRRDKLKQVEAAIERAKEPLKTGATAGWRQKP